MGLTKEQEEEMYRDTIATKTIVCEMKKQLEKGDMQIENCKDGVNALKIEQALIKGKLGAFILGLTFIASLLVNGVLYVWSHLGGRS